MSLRKKYWQCTHPAKALSSLTADQSQMGDIQQNYFLEGKDSREIKRMIVGILASNL